MKIFGLELGLAKGIKEFLVRDGTLKGFNIDLYSQKLEKLNNNTPIKGIVDMHYLDNPLRIKVFFDQKATSEQAISEWLIKEKLI
jgi:hypothetical protein